MSRPRTVVWLAAFALLLVAGGCDNGPMTPGPRVRSVEVEPEELTLSVDTRAEVDAVVDTEGGASPEVRWSSRRGRVATVDSQGLVTARDTGRTAVVATAVADTTKKDSSHVTVIFAPCPAVANVSVSPSEATITVDSTVDFDATVRKLDTARAIWWTSRDTSVATVDSTGTARGESAGSTDITVNVDYPGDLRCFADTARASAALEVVEP